MLSIFIVLCSTITFRSVLAVTVGGFDNGGDTLVSAMMMFLGNEDSVYVLDKYEQNAARVSGHPAWGSLWDVKTHRAVVMDVRTSSYCASGMHLPNGSYITFGGDEASTTNGTSIPPGGGVGIRIVNPCTISDNLTGGNCGWMEDPTQLAMKKQRWYSSAEATGEGRVVIIGGMVKGGYINRVVPNTDPATEGGSAEPTYEYFPPMDGVPQTLQFIVQTSGLNAFTYAFLMPSGKMLLQANHSTTLWDHIANTESALPDMPNGIIRVYPASGATAMLPLTPANNWTPTILFCGGTTIADQDWGSYDGAAIDVWNVLASTDCQRLTPEPADGLSPIYEQDEDMLEPRTMGQFVLLPTGQLLLLNGGQKGTGGYEKNTSRIMPFGASYAAAPVLRPAIYDPNAPEGSRWSNAGLGSSQIPRLYHATAMLLPDGSVMAAGSNPNPDVNLTAVFPTEYRADIFYPPYFSATVRPSPQNLPKTLSYGGPYFDILIPADSYSGSGNDAANATIVTIVRSGFSTHAMNMGQRFMQLNNTYTVYTNGSIVLHVSQLPPNPNLFQPGPALLYVCVKGIPSVGKLVIIGNGSIGSQPVSNVTYTLPESVHGVGTGSASNDGPPASATIAAISASVAALIILILVIIVWIRRRRAQAEVVSDYSIQLRGRTIPGLSVEDVDNLLYPGGRAITVTTNVSRSSELPQRPETNSSRKWDSPATSHSLYMSHQGEGSLLTPRRFSSSQLYVEGGTQVEDVSVVGQLSDLTTSSGVRSGDQKQDRHNVGDIKLDPPLDAFQLDLPPSYNG